MDTAKEIESISNIIKGHDLFLIFSHIFPDGDSLGSQAAAYCLLRELGKKAYMVCSDEIPYQYRYLPNLGQVIKDYKDIPLPSRPVILCLDCADEARMGIDFESLKQQSKVIVNIDHHTINSRYGDINLIDSRKCATAQILFEIMDKNFGRHINRDIAISIYTGILTDTGKFQYENTTATVHKIVSRLLEFDIIPAEIFSNIYENEPFNRIKLLELVFKRIKLINDQGIIYSYTLQEDFKKLDLPFSAQDGIIEILRGIEKIKIAALIKQVEGNRFKVSLRTSRKNLNVAELAARFGGGGHQMAAAYSQEGSIEAIVKDLLESVKNHGKNRF
ncbi:MAG: bifunctional oligoribonuclease/PAP phosphatase NrnA [Actinomycetota bacterium]|nr:bifunctional oligoribonuclease/PAP phosphatase NrnA [Actinomycetota bacterium]